MNDRDYLTEFAKWYLHRAAVLIRATEAAAFTVHRDGAARFECLVHLRPDDASEEVREAARKGFLKLVTPCVNEDKNGVIKLRNRPQSNKPQFCLVVPIPVGMQKPIVVAAFIGEYADPGEARENMQIAALMVPPPSGP